MTTAEAIKEAATKLQPKRIMCAEEKNLGRLEAEILLSHVLNRDRVFLLAHPLYPLPSIIYHLFSRLVSRRLKHEPIAYILGEKEFYGRDFIVTPDVLIPRPETELMIDSILANHNPTRPPLKLRGGKEGLLVCDIGTGSGAIAITLAKELREATVIATDSSPAALKVARRNARRLKADDVSFVQASLLDAKMLKRLKSLSRKFGSLIIAANLPYLPLSDKKILDPDVVRYEPSKALFTGREGLELIIKLLDQIAFHKNRLPFKHISIYLEFDPPQAKELKKLAKTLFPSALIEIKKDLAKRDRLLSIMFENSR